MSLKTLNDIKLSDVIDTSKLQRMAELLYSAGGIPIGIIGMDNTIYAAAGWQDICAKFHRQNAQCRERCFQSDAYIQSRFGDETGFVEYKCLNGMWDIASPLIIEGRHLATLFLGQFFYEGELKDTEFFKKQAARFGFDETAYLEALERVPFFSRARVRDILEYYDMLIKTLAETGNLQYQRMMALDRLQKTENTFRMLFESLTEGVALHELVTNEAGEAVNYRIIDINPAYEKIVGLKKEAVVGRLATEAYGVDSPPYLKEFTRVAVEGGIFQFETYFPPMRKHFSISVVCYEQNHFATVFFDVTDIKNAAAERERIISELESKNAELERFTYTVSHDLKSPLITIKGFLGMLDGDIARGDETRIKSDIRRIAVAADKMAALLDDLLELSRIGRIINPPSEFPLGALIGEVIEALDAPVKECRADITVDDGLPSAYADRKRVFEVLQNLIENAIKFRKPGAPPRIRIGAAEENGFVKIFVKDDGAGVEPRYFDNIFGLFNKLDSKSEGTGIGLALVKRIAEVHGGKAWVESQGPGKGSVFYFTLPQKKTEVS